MSVSERGPVEPGAGELRGMVVGITGAGSGIGRALAEGFRRDGAQVSGCDLAANAGEAGHVCDLAVEADVTDLGAMASWVDRTIERLGRLDVVVANAGICRWATLESAPPGDFEAIYRVNVFGVVNTFKASLSPMRSQGRGRLIAVCSRTAELCLPELSAYASSKAAVIAIVRTLAHELQDTGADLLVNAMFPGICRTAMSRSGDGRDPALAYPTARRLATLEEGGPSGRTFSDDGPYPIYAEFATDTRTWIT
jgi:NAD(P)-dependent dehydrogenase (short-subunit alcohol dehydrogenase family)